MKLAALPYSALSALYLLFSVALSTLRSLRAETYDEAFY